MSRALTATLFASLALASGVAVASPPKKDPPPKPAPGEPAKPPADNRRIVGILDVKVEGVPPEVAAQFQHDLDAQVDTKHYWLAPRSRMHERMANSTKWTEGCVVGQCLGEVKTQTGADLVLLAALTGAGTSFGYVVTLVRTDTGRVLAQESERCDVCTVNEALSAATLAAVKILNAVPDKLPDDQAEQRAALDVATTRLEQKLGSAHHNRKVVGITLTVAGLVTAAAGAALYVVKHHPSYAVATTAAGGGLAAGGITVLTF